MTLHLSQGISFANGTLLAGDVAAASGGLQRAGHQDAGDAAGSTETLAGNAGLYAAAFTRADHFDVQIKIIEFCHDVFLLFFM